MEVGQHVRLAGRRQQLRALVAADLGEDIPGAGLAASGSGVSLVVIAMSSVWACV